MRGKPVPVSEVSRAPGTPRSSFDIGGQVAITYSSGLYTTITHLHASFEPTESKKLPRFILGTDEVGWARRTDVNYGKVDGWGSSDPQTFLQFEERFPGDALWGLGAGNTVGVPNVMDLSQPFGMIYGEGSPGGLVYFRSTDEMRGRFLAFSKGVSVPDLGIPEIPGTMESICSVWIAKSTDFVSMTGGLIGILSGSSYGIVTAYSLGTDGLRDQRLGRGEITARWVVSPGVPIVGISVDDRYGPGRQAEKRCWVVVLNALGEVYYLTDLPGRRRALGTKLDEDSLERLAWQTGRTVYWQLIEPTRRLARHNPYNEVKLHASYSPRSSWEEMGLSKEQLINETKEIERYLRYSPKHFREKCQGWDMKRRLEVDFAAGGVDSRESVIVIECGGEARKSARIRRFIRCCNIHDGSSPDESRVMGYQHKGPTSWTGNSLVSGSNSEIIKECLEMSPMETPASKTPGSVAESAKWISSLEEWRISELSFGTIKAGEITTSTIDKSTYALLTPAEDPLLKISGSSATSSLTGSPIEQGFMSPSVFTTPGQRARFLTVGTKNGTILLWDVRGAKPDNAEIVNSLPPVRVIHTDSPQISCLALTALYLVHGGNDGLVQAWDPLASSNLPIRTLNSRFSSRARRRLIQAQSSSEQAVGVNLFAAGAICLDPDPTVLRGMISLGAHLRYWSYSSSAASQYANSRKRRVRRNERRSNNNGGENFSGTGRGALKDYINNERLELELERDRKKKEADRLAGRFGVGLLGQGANDEEMMAYAKMLSEESFAQDEEKRKGETDSMRGSGSQAVTSSSSSSPTITPEGSTIHDEYLDEDLAEALQRSLTDSIGNPETNIPIKYVKRNQRSSSSSTTPLSKVATVAEPSSSSSSSSHPQRKFTYRHNLDDEDFDFALQLSLAEEESRKTTVAASSMGHQELEEDFPSLGSSHGCGIPENGASSDGNGESSKNENGNGRGKGKRRVV